MYAKMQGPKVTKSIDPKGWMYLTVNHLAFYSYVLGREKKELLRWTDITSIKQSHNILMPESISVTTRDHDIHFSMFLHKSETYDLINQLANLAMRKLINDDNYETDLDLLLKRSKNVPKKASYLKRDLDAKKMSEGFRMIFQVPNSEKLDGQACADETAKILGGVDFDIEISGRVLPLHTLQ